MAKINGRTLKFALAMIRRHRFGRIQPTAWVDVCTTCDAPLLRPLPGLHVPFLCVDGVMRTVRDFPLAPHESMMFGRFAMSRDALLSAIALAAKADPSTRLVEAQGNALMRDMTGAAALRFSEAVCNWGRGQRVWANLLRRNERSALGLVLGNWLTEAAASGDVEEAITVGIGIEGLGVSFASKHLRMIDPARFPVLDQVLSEGLGYALNAKGYALFADALETFEEHHGLGLDIATLESGLFLLVRQQVRANR